MKKLSIISIVVIAFILLGATISNSSAFLGDRKKGIGYEVTSGGDLKLLPKTTVGRTYISNEAVFLGNVSFSDSKLTLDSTLTLQNGATLTNPDSLVLTEAGGIKLANATRAAGTFTSTGTLTASGALTVVGTTTLATSITGILKAASGVVSAAVANTDYPTVAKYDSLRNYLADGLLSISTLAISATAEKFKTTTTSYYTISGIQYSKTATDNLVFSDAYTVNTASAAGTFYGIFLIQINAAGTVSTLAPSADQVYASSALALAALPSPTAANTPLGYIIVQCNDTDDWVANTDDMTDGSDCLTATFTDYAVKVLPGACQ